MSITVEVAGIDRTAQWDRSQQTGWDDQLNGRGTGRITFNDVVGGFRPSDGQAIEIIENGTVRFGGILMEPEETEPEGAGVLFFTCVIADFNILADRRTVGREFDNVAFEEIVSGIVTIDMAGEGIDLSGVETGAAYSPSFANVPATEAFNALSDATGRAWWIDENKVLNFKDRASVAAPADMDGDTLLAGSITVRSDRQKYRNEQIVRAGTDEFPIMAVSGNLTEQSARAAIEGTSGIYSAVQDEPEIMRQDFALDKAGDLLERFDDITTVAKGRTRTVGFRAGQSVNVDLPNHNINDVEMLIDSVTAEIVSIGNDDDEIWYTLTAITGDPFGGWLEHFRKPAPIGLPLRFANTPGLFRIDPTPGVVVHDPDPDGMEWFQGSASGTLDSTPQAIGITNNEISNGGSGTDSNFVVTLRRGPIATPRKSILEKWIIDANEIVITSPNAAFEWDELVASTFKTNLVLSPDNTYAAFVERDPGNDPIFGLVNIAGLGFLGSVTMTGGVDSNTPTEGVWFGDYVFWPGGTGANIFVFDVSIPTAPVLDNTFATTLTNVEALALSPDGQSMYATGSGSNKVSAIDISDPTAPVEDDTQVLTRSYISIGVNEDGTYMTMLVRAGSGTVGYAIISMAGTTMTLETEDTIALSTAIMDGSTTLFSNNSVITARQRTPSGANSLELHVFDFAEATKTLALRETLSYNHSSTGNTPTVKSSANNRIANIFGFNTDAQITYGQIQYNTAVPLTIDYPLRVGFGGTGVASYAAGDILYAGRSLPDDTRGNGALETRAIGDELDILTVSGALPVWLPATAQPQRPLTEDLDMAGFLFTGAPGLRGWIDGFVMSNDTDTAHDVQVSPGACANALDTNNQIVELTTGITKQIDAAWAEGDDAGGMATGSVTSGTEYNVILIHEDGDPTNLDATFDVDPGGANTASGWVAARRIGSVFTETAAAEIRQFTQVGNLFKFAEPPPDIVDGSGTPGTFETATLINCPPGARVQMSARGAATTADIAVQFSEAGQGSTGAVNVAGNEGFDGGAGTRAVVAYVAWRVDSSKQFDYTLQSTGTWTEFDVDVIGYEDPRGKE